MQISIGECIKSKLMTEGMIEVGVRCGAGQALAGITVLNWLFRIEVLQSSRLRNKKPFGYRLSVLFTRSAIGSMLEIKSTNTRSTTILRHNRAKSSTRLTECSQRPTQQCRSWRVLLFKSTVVGSFICVIAARQLPDNFSLLLFCKTLLRLCFYLIEITHTHTEFNSCIRNLTATHSSKRLPGVRQSRRMGMRTLIGT